MTRQNGMVEREEGKGGMEERKGGGKGEIGMRSVTVHFFGVYSMCSIIIFNYNPFKLFEWQVCDMVEDAYDKY